MTSAFDLDQAVPWGRNRAEYLAFFENARKSAGFTFLSVCQYPLNVYQLSGLSSLNRRKTDACQTAPN